MRAKTVFLAMAMLSTAGCASTSILFEDGYTDVYQSRTDRFTRTTCTSGPHSVRVVMPRDELEAIGEQASASGFFALPAELDAPGSGEQPDGTITVSSPCAGYRLRITHAGRSNEVAWQCAQIGARDAPPPGIAGVVDRLRALLYSRPDVQSLPASGCVYY